MKILIVGAGAIGVLFASKLIEGGCDVLLVDNNLDTVEVINRDGLVVERMGAKHVATARASAPSAAGGFGPDLAMFCVKAYATRAAALGVFAALGPDAVVLSLQNGIGNVEILSEIFGPDHVAAGSTSHGATALGPGHIRHAGEGETVMGAAAGLRREYLERIAIVFNSCGIATRITGNTSGVLWSKLIVNVGINPLTALLDIENGKLLDIPEAAELMADAVREAAAVAEKLGIDTGPENHVENVRLVARRTGGNVSSMLQDIRSGRPTEIDFICGAVVRAGQSAGVATPVNRVLWNLVKAKEKEKGLTQRARRGHKVHKEENSMSLPVFFVPFVKP